MADNVCEMDSAVPAKRSRLDFSSTLESDNSANNFNSVVKTPELISGK